MFGSIWRIKWHNDCKPVCSLNLKHMLFVFLSWLCIVQREQASAIPQAATHCLVNPCWLQYLVNKPPTKISMKSSWRKWGKHQPCLKVWYSSLRMWNDLLCWMFHKHLLWIWLKLIYKQTWIPCMKHSVISQLILMFVCFFSRYVRRPDTEDWYKDDEEGNEVVENGGKLEWHFTNMYHQFVNTVGLW